MKRASSLIFQAVFAAAVLLHAPVIHAQSTPVLQNIYGRSHVSLNGRWHYLVDPYETGFYDYLRNAFDEQRNGRGFYEDRKQKDKGDRVEGTISHTVGLLANSRQNTSIIARRCPKFSCLPPVRYGQASTRAWDQEAYSSVIGCRRLD